MRSLPGVRFKVQGSWINGRLVHHSYIPCTCMYVCTSRMYVRTAKGIFIVGRTLFCVMFGRYHAGLYGDVRGCSDMQCWMATCVQDIACLRTYMPLIEHILVGN